MSSEPATTARGATTAEEPGRARANLARRVAEARATVPDLTLTAEADLTAAQAAHPGVPARDLAARALALALREHPQLNASYRDARFERYARVNVAIAVDTAETTVFPTLFDADASPLDDLAARAADLVARAGALTAPETAGATCAVVAVGTGGVRGVVPAPAGGHAVTLGVGPVARRAVVRGGEVAVAPVTDLALVADHRIARPGDAAPLLARVVALLEDAAAL